MSEVGNNARFDWLTAFFVVAAIVLAGMWWLEQARLDTIETASLRAGEFSRDHLGASCEAFSVGQGGSTLVVRCEDRGDLNAAKKAVAAAASGFDVAVFVQPDSDAVRCELPDVSNCKTTDVAAYE